MTTNDKKPPKSRPGPAGQSRAISPDLQGQGRYKASLHSEGQKFPNRKAIQLRLTEAGIQEDEKPVEVYGLDLSVSEAKALSAIQILFSRIGYKGNLPGQSGTFPLYKWEGVLPRQAITYPEYFEAYGLKKVGGKYQGTTRVEAEKALKSLETPRRIVYRRKYWKGRRQLSDLIVVTAPLLSISSGYEGLEEQEAEQVIEGQDLSHRVTKMIIELGPLLVDGIEDFYVLKPETLFSEIEQASGGKKVSRTYSLFIEWLLTKNTRTITVGEDVLAERLRLSYLIETWQRPRLRAQLQKAFAMAKELEYLLEYKEDPFGMWIFTLNPARMGRQLGRGQDAPEAD